MASLRNIDERLENLIKYGFDMETGEILESDEEFQKLVDELQISWKDKIDNCILLAIDKEADVKKIDDEIARLEKLKKPMVNSARWLKGYVDMTIRKHYLDEENNLDTEGLKKFEIKDNPLFKLSYSKSTKTEILDESKIPKNLVEKVTTVELKYNKNDIKKEVKKYMEEHDNEQPEYAKLIEYINMKIK